MTDETRNYRETLHLPQTDFPMKAGLPTSEPKILAHWQKLNLYERLRQQSAECEKYILHDGPPYANGELHIGHALNKILKDIITRAQQMMGKNAIYVPGWDCHGLPIEWKIEEKYRAAGKDKDNVPIIEFRAECRKFADKWMAIQSEQFQRFGIIGDWAKPYTTMDFAAEAAIVEEFQKFIMNGSLYRGAKPVMWSVVEKTALAEAEVEYAEHVSPTIFVKFKIKSSTDKALNKIISEAGGEASDEAGGEARGETNGGVSLVIWTTTPWTIPGNRAVAYSKQLSYGLYRINYPAPASSEWLIFCDSLAEQAMHAAGIEDYSREGDIDMQQISTCAHPFAE
ncbi:MAG: class I tRNA ligase family protein, partial [Alphaproteobacteria bacterium]|nr:class I tRNA ligase family protein [Alphaproteobacteria bacterium]